MRKCFVLGTLLLQATFLSAQTTPATTSLPDTPVGRATSTLLGDFNAGTLTAPRWVRWRQIVGRVTVRKVETRSPTRVVVWVQGIDSRALLGWEINADGQARVDPDSVVVFWLGGRPAPELRPVQVRMTEERDLAPALDAYFTRMEAADLFSGTVIVAREGNIVFQGAYGMADKASGIPNRLNTRFALASVGKVFTAAAVATLVSAGRLSFSDTIGRFLPDYPYTTGRSATIGQLLAHTAGLGSSPIDWIARREPTTLSGLVTLTAVEPRFAPGTDVQYCNECFLIAGLSVERVSGEPYEAFVRQHVFQPAGMTATGWDRITDQDPRRAIPYSNYRRVDANQVFVPGPRRDATDLQGLKGTPAGGSYATAGDLLAFVTALRSCRIANCATTEVLVSHHAEQPFGRANGYGFELMKQPVQVIGKGGNAQGTSAQVEWYPESGYEVIVLSNYDMSAQVAAEGIRELLFSR